MRESFNLPVVAQISDGPANCSTTVISSLKAIDEALQEAKGSSFMRRLKQVLHPSASGDIDSQASDTELQEAYVNWAKNNSLDYVDLRSEIPAGTSKDKVTYRHVFTQSITATKSALPKRRLEEEEKRTEIKADPHLPAQRSRKSWPRSSCTCRRLGDRPSSCGGSDLCKKNSKN